MGRLQPGIACFASGGDLPQHNPQFPSVQSGQISASPSTVMSISRQRFSINNRLCLTAQAAKLHCPTLKLILIIRIKYVDDLVYFEAVDEYLDLVEYNSCQDNQFTTEQYNDNQQQQYGVPHKSYGGDSVVPVQCEKAKIHQFPQQQQQQQQQNFQLEMDYETSNTGYCYPGSLSHSVSVSSMDVGIVPESTVSDVSNSISHPRPPKGTIDLFSSPPIQIPTQLTSMDREARVLRYREKKKTRKFEKTIRYASRKAYAETRPRIKGRFAKRTDVEVEVDQMFSSTLMAENGYGIVPSF